jgi:hypothetical protein
MQQTATITRSPLWGRFDRDRRHLERQYAEPAYDPDTGLARRRWSARRSAAFWTTLPADG